MSATTDKLTLAGRAGLLLKKYLGQISMIGVGIAVAAIFFPFVCGQKTSVTGSKSDTVIRYVHDIKPDTSLHSGRDTLWKFRSTGTREDNSDCPAFSVIYDLGGNDTLWLRGIRSRTQSIDTLEYVLHHDTILVRSRDSIFTTVHDSVTLLTSAKIPALGYAVSGYLSTEAAGAVIDGHFKQFHIFAGPRLDYTYPGSIWKKIGIEAGFSYTILSSMQ